MHAGAEDAVDALERFFELRRQRRREPRAFRVHARNELVLAERIDPRARRGLGQAFVGEDLESAGGVALRDGDVELAVICAVRLFACIDARAAERHDDSIGLGFATGDEHPASTKNSAQIPAKTALRAGSGARIEGEPTGGGSGRKALLAGKSGATERDT